MAEKRPRYVKAHVVGGSKISVVIEFTNDRSPGHAMELLLIKMRKAKIPLSTAVVVIVFAEEKEWAVHDKRRT